MHIRKFVLALSACAGFSSAAAVDRGTVRLPEEDQKLPLIEAYEPNILGYTNQSDDVWFANIQLSLKYQLLRKIIWGFFHRGEGNYNPVTDRQRLYLTFTGIFGFYIRTRPSGPVVGKSYNPKLLWRYIPSPEQTVPSSATPTSTTREYTEYIDVAYAHDSDGQSIDNAGEYYLAEHTSQRAAYALDQVSRGWDYVQIAAKRTSEIHGSARNQLSLYGDLKFFLRHGFLQGVPEEYHDFENDRTARPRHAYDGITAAVEWKPFVPEAKENRWLSNPRFMLQDKTGYDPVARFHTIRGEFGFQLLELPIAFFVQDGYMNSLARYYKKARAVGIELRIAE